MFVEKECIKCHRLYKPSSRHSKCPKCRAIDNKHKCVCGKMIKFESNLCIKCNNNIMNKIYTSRKPDGHKRIKHSGYMMIKSSNHPRADRYGMVLEHIVVMEKHLNRYLLPGENVHHINGVKDDNRIENLELWTKPQPSGIRVKDALTWAREIIKKYEHIEDKL